MSPGRRSWTAAEVRQLGVQTDVATASRILGIGRTKGYELIQRGEFPVTVLRLGHRLIVPVAPLLELLGLERDDAD